jgi:branched-chain amino acid transport system substrate-binding protein
MRKTVILVASFLVLFSLPAWAQTPLKLGLLLDMSGPYADITGEGTVTAARMAVDDFGGKALGRPIEIVFADHQNKPDIAASLARQWFDNEGVEAILDVAASAPALAVNEIAKQRGRILVVSGPGVLRLTNEECGPYTVHYAYDNYALAKGTGVATVKAGYDSWFFVTADYVFGRDLERITSAFVKANGGNVLGSVRAPLNTADFSSFLLQAQASPAKVVGLANAGADTINAIKQAAEFGIGKSNQKLAALLLFISDVNSLGLETAQGLLLTSAFYWDLNDETRAWSRSYFEKMKKMPDMDQAGVYSSILHYLQAVAATGTVDADAVMKMMKTTPINDVFAHNGRIREDGRMVHNMYLFEVKKPSESKERWDDYKLVATIPAEEAFPAIATIHLPACEKIAHEARSCASGAPQRPTNSFRA